MSAGTMWEPFTLPARQLVIRVQQTARLFGSPVIGIEHFLFALAGGDDSAPHLALGVIEAEPPPLVDGVTLDEVRDEVERLARAYEGGAPKPTP